jgi:hypothetical protein
VLAFTFPGGQVDSGRVILSADAQTSYDQATGTVVARMANTGPIFVEISCACFLEGPGFCFAFEIPGSPPGKKQITCAYSEDCAGQTMDFCVMTITNPAGFQLKFRAPAAQVDSTRRIGAGPCGPQGALG